MNIKEAKETIQYTLQAYFQKDESGYPLVPLRQQRPILLIGPPGIGKTAIMEQIAGECGAGLVAYTMTHHTRQSAMGLPKIVERTFDDAQVSVTEYTMSEIIASIYACMEKTGKKRGILFLDEINCVSETLAPVMLQLLQDKTFGNQKLPTDWLIVAAGNPPEYNKSVREAGPCPKDRAGAGYRYLDGICIVPSGTWQYPVVSGSTQRSFLSDPSGGRKKTVCDGTGMGRSVCSAEKL